METGDWIGLVYFTGWAVFAAIVLVSNWRGNWSGDDAALMALAGCGWPLLIIGSPVFVIEWFQERRCKALSSNETTGREGQTNG